MDDFWTRMYDGGWADTLDSRDAKLRQPAISPRRELEVPPIGIWGTLAGLAVILVTGLALMIGVTLLFGTIGFPEHFQITKANPCGGSSELPSSPQPMCTAIRSAEPAAVRNIN
jgi:hypothetical protein